MVTIATLVGLALLGVVSGQKPIGVQQIWVSGPFRLCDLQFEQYSMIMNATAWDDADSACQAFGMDLADVPISQRPSSPPSLQRDLTAARDQKSGPLISTVGTVLLDCAMLGGVHVTAGWVASRDGAGQAAGGPDANCFAVDATGTLISGSLSSCREGKLFPLCKRRKANDRPQGTLVFDRQYVATPDPSSGPVQSAQGPTWSDVFSGSSRPGTQSQCRNCTAKPVCPLSLLGFKIIPQPMSYAEAECSCAVLGMRLAEPQFLPMWPSAFAAYHCAGGIFAGGQGATAWVDSTPGPHPALQPYDQANGCIALKVQHLGLQGPRYVPMPCKRLLPALCMGPMLEGWSDLDPLFTLMGMQNVAASLNSVFPLPRLPALTEAMGMLPLKSGRVNTCFVTKFRLSDDCSLAGLRAVDPLALDSTDKRAIRELMAGCPDAPEFGAALARARDNEACSFVDRAGNFYQAGSAVAKAVYPACSPLANSKVVCRA